MDLPVVESVGTPTALRRLVGFRYAFAALALASVAGVQLAFAVPVRWVPVAAALVALLAVNGLLQWRVIRQQTVSEHSLFINFGLEVFALTALLVFVGGSTSPLVSLYLLPLTMAAQLLARRHTWILAGLTAICYTLLFVLGGESAVPEHDHAGHGDTGSNSFSEHLFGMWIVFLVSAGLVAHYVSSLAESVRARDRELARAREESLRNERIVALGTLGAGAAHELGTPLSTIGMLAEDMAFRHAAIPDLATDVALLQGEVTRCKEILNALTQATGSMRGEGGSAMAADAFLDRTIDRWQILRPATPADVRWIGPAAPGLPADQTLEQALLNLLNNAADASPAGIEIAGHARGNEVVIDIIDKGSGMSSEVERRAGELFFTTKAEVGGMGIGLFLANATIERFGGSVRLFNREEGGCCTRVSLPAVQLAYAGDCA
jgi:two-component system, sensor histidine kinase RegB